MRPKPSERDQLKREWDELRQRVAELDVKLQACRGQLEMAERFRVAFENSTVAKSLTGIDGTLHVNRAFCEMVGYSEEEVRKLSWRDLTHPDDVAESERVLQSFVEGTATRAHYEKRYLHKSGRVVWGEVVTALQRDSQGRPAFLITSVSDITERKRIAAELRQAHLVLQSIRSVDQLIARERDTAVLIRRTCEILTETRGFSSAWIALFDKSGAYTMGASAGLGEAFPELEKRARTGCLGLCAQALQGGGVHYVDDPAARCPGCPAAPGYAGHSALAVRLEHGGRTFGLLVIAMDAALAVRRQEQELLGELAADLAFALNGRELERNFSQAIVDLAANEERYRSLFDHMNEGFFEAEIITDPAGHPVDFRFVDVNPAHGRILGLPREQVVGQTGSRLFPGLEPEWLESVGQVALTGAPKRVEGFVAATGRWYANSYFSPAPGRFASVFSDITESKQAQAKIESLARFPGENPNVVLRLGVDGTILYANPGSAALLGDWGVATGDQLPERLRPSLGEAIGSGSGVALEVACGERRYSLNLAPIPAAGYVNVYGRDITEQAQAEGRLRSSEKRYRSLFEGMLNGVSYCRMIFDGDEPRDFVYLAVNQAFESLTGLHDVVGKRVSELIPGIREADPEVFAIYGRVARTGRPERFENYVEPLKMWFLVSAYSPQPGDFVAVFDIITERKRLDFERSATVELLSLVNRVRDVPSLVRLAVEFVQKTSGCQAVGIRLREGDDYPYCETRGFPPEFVELENWLCARHADGRVMQDASGQPLIACMCGNVIRGRFDAALPFFTEHGSFWTNSTTELLATTTEAERQGRTRNRCNGEGYESVALIPLRVGDERVGLLQLNDPGKGRFTLEAIALWERLAGHLAVALAKLRAEEELVRHRDDLERNVADRTRRLAEANREMEAFAYSVSHDLRAPLRAIDGFTRILVDEQGPSLDAEGRRLCGIIRQNTERMGKLIDDILSLSRTGRAELQLREVDMRALAEEVFEELTTPEDRQRIDWRIEALPPAVVDPSLMRQVWQNLLSNAVKFSSKLQRAEIRVRGERGERESVYRVEDNGAGFDMLYANKLFRAFERLHSSRDFEGTGIGLALVQQIVRRHDGRLWAEGQPERGATFSFSLPRKET
jgi:PAS domain S-box-containing protein